LGLPNETAWTLDLGAAAYGIQGSAYNTTLPGGSVSVGGEPVYGTNGTAYYATKVTLIPLVRNSSWQNFSTLPATVLLAGPALVEVTYAAEYWGRVAAGRGGSVSPASQWVHVGQSIRINES